MIRILYDGECPFCTAYARYARLRRRVGEVDLIDARQAPDLVEDYAAQGYEIDESFIVNTGDAVLTGGAAMAYIHGNLAPRWTGLGLLTNPRMLATVYPSLRWMRNSALRAMGRKPIHAAAKPPH